MPNLEKLTTEPQPPFRKEVTESEFTKIRDTRETITEVLPQLVTEPGDRVFGAALMQEIIINPDTPAEVKLEAMKQGLDLISGWGNDENNEETALILIDSIRGCSNPDLRIRLAAVLSHDLQDKYLAAQAQNLDKDALVDAFKRKEAFQKIVSDSEQPPAYQAWARYLLEPRGALDVFNKLYDKNPDLNLLPRIKEEITDIEESGPELAKNIVETDNYMVVRLNPPRIYSQEKREIYKRFFGHEPSLYATHRVGAKYVSVEFPSDLSNSIASDVEEFRRRKISRKEVVSRADILWQKFLAQMNEEQRSEFLKLIEVNNLEIRFATLRPIPDIPGDKIEEPEESKVA